jgi:ribosomal protein L16/L10AE
MHAYTPVTSKGIAARQGRGKGKVSVHVCSVQAGTFLFEVLCTDRARVISAFRIGSFLLPIKTTLVERSIV